MYIIISILAPARGATAQPWPFCSPCRFQFSPLREGRRRGLPTAACAGCYFNSRPCERGDAAYDLARAREEFQFSPLREGRRYTMPCFHPSLIISILAPARGATGSRRRTAGGGSFQFSPLREGRLFFCLSKAEEQISILAPARGATCGTARRSCSR